MGSPAGESTGVGGVGRLRWVPPGDWALWTRPVHVIVYVVLVDLAAAALTTVLVFHALTSPGAVTGRQWLHLLALVAACGIYTEISRGIERIRREYRGTPHVELHSVWFFAATLVIPAAGLVGLMVIAAALQRWLRVRHHVAHRRTFATAATMLAVYTGSSLLHLLAYDPSGRTLANFAVITVAAVVYYLVGFTPIAVAVLLTARHPSPQTVLGRGRDHAIEAATMGLGFFLAWALLDWWPAGGIVAGVTLVLHGSVLMRQLRDSARSDPKTGLLNTAGFDEIGGRELNRTSRHSGNQVAMLMLDLDHFKRTNDTHGHLAGDQLILAIARTLASEVRSYDVVGRFGGDEFMILLPATSASEARHVADRIRRRIAALSLVVHSRHGTTRLQGPTTASIGIAVYPTHGTTIQQLRKAADDAAARAKTTGGNYVAVATRPPRPGFDPAAADTQPLRRAR